MAEKFIRSYNEYSSGLGDALFPGTDFYSRRAKSRFSEAWMNYGKDMDSVDAFLLHLHQFIPSDVKDSIEHPSNFTSLVVQEWEEDKKVIETRLRELL